MLRMFILICTTKRITKSCSSVRVHKFYFKLVISVHGLFLCYCPRKFHFTEMMKCTGSLNSAGDQPVSSDRHTDNEQREPVLICCWLEQISNIHLVQRCVLLSGPKCKYALKFITMFYRIILIITLFCPFSIRRTFPYQ